MMTTPLISLIVPTYNLKNYLAECLDSLLCQTYQNFEIILIDDGSTDGTAKVCDDYAAHFDQIRAIHQKNSGLSAARNAGIQAASGELLAFIDGDDLISPNFLANLVAALRASDADLAVCAFREFEKTSDLASQPDLASQLNLASQLAPASRLNFATPPANPSTSAKTPQSAKPPVVLSGEQATVKLLVGQENLEIMSCNKLYKRELFTDITFPIGELHEDSLTTYKLFAQAKRVVYLDQKLYFYRQNRQGSIMHSQNLLARLKQREKAAREAIAYFDATSPQPTTDLKTATSQHLDSAACQHLKSAAEISLLTAKFAYLDATIAGRLPKSYGVEAENWLKSHKHVYTKNPYLTKKLRAYLINLWTYKLFRSLKI